MEFTSSEPEPEPEYTPITDQAMTMTAETYRVMHQIQDPDKIIERTEEPRYRYREYSDDDDNSDDTDVDPDPMLKRHKMALRELIYRQADLDYELRGIEKQKIINREAAKTTKREIMVLNRTIRETRRRILEEERADKYAQKQAAFAPILASFLNLREDAQQEIERLTEQITQEQLGTNNPAELVNLNKQLTHQHSIILVAQDNLLPQCLHVNADGILLKNLTSQERRKCRNCFTRMLTCTYCRYYAGKFDWNGDCCDP